MKYTIKYGDTLSELAVRFNTTTDALARANNISDPNKIYAGRTIEVPGVSTAPWSFDLWTAIKRFIWGS
jgi:putative chitinase